MSEWVRGGRGDGDWAATVLSRGAKSEESLCWKEG